MVWPHCTSFVRAFLCTPSCGRRMSWASSGAQRASRSVVPSWIPHQCHEHVLHNFFRAPSASRHAQRKPKQGSLVPPVEEHKSLLVAFRGTPQQNVVSLLLGDPHPPCGDARHGLILTFPELAGKVPAAGRSGSGCINVSLHNRLDGSDGYCVSRRQPAPRSEGLPVSGYQRAAFTLYAS